ncbi:hypothetical protein GGR51DRAFT_368392 [Nemania sp. FL0031]|nr:hypothetical protein GGR51DRAFT_368392 [Nemania sp. FL0031]
MISFLQDESIPTLRRYGKIVLASPAHSWLVSSLNREADLIQAEPNIMNEIRKSILAPLPLSRRFNGVDTLPKFGVKFDIGWNPSHFFTQQFEERIPDVLASTLTLTGSFEDAQATTCMSYMQQTWPTSGAYTVELLDKVLWEPEVWNECKLPDDTAIFARIQKSELIVVVLGMRDAIAEVGEQLAWIAAALRLAPNYQGVYSCRPSIQQIRIGEDPTKLPRAIQPLSARFNVSCEISDSPTGRYSFGRCWHSLFKNPTIVHGYPIPRKARKNTGLEIPLDIMADLVQASQITTFGDKIFLKGFSSMLVLMDQIEDSIIWHLDFSHDGSYISYTDASEPPNVESIVVENIMGNIMKSRHIIGWCLKAKFYTGTDKAPYPVKKPTLQPLNDECILHGIEPPWIKSIGKHHSYHRANRERPTHLHFGENLHLRKLEKLKDQYVILWDVDSKKGWLVNGISAWLHLLRARLKHISEDGNHGPELREPSIISRYTVHSASEFFKKAENMNLPVYPNEYHGQGRPFTVMDQSNRLYDILTNLIELQGVAVRSQAYASRKYLSGWAFRDLAMEKEQFEPYVTDLPEKGRSWVDFTRGIFAVTLFGRGFGELIRPDNSCEAWSELPTGEFFLATSGQILRRIMDDVGNSPGQPWRLGKDIVWHNPTKACQCSGKAESKHADNIQVLLPEDISKDIPQSIGSEEPADNSAFVFGFNPESSWRWQEFGCPTKSTPPTSPEDFKYLTPVDSGIGSESGMSETPPCSPRLYTVGILCTLPEEGAAMKTVFDEIYDEPDHYVLGSIGNHNVALAYLPLESGIAAASTAASKLGTDFPTIKFGLLVGIAGGIPSNTTDIRLGDVVVGVPQGTHPGVIQLGRGKDLEQNGFQRTGSLNRPPTSLLSTVASMTADSQHCSLQLNNIIRTVEESGPKYQYPGQEFDILHSAPCDQCVDKCTDRGSHIPNRQSRDAAYPVVHRGLIGSGDTVIKDAQKRDELAKQYGIICVEMEAAGVMHSDIPFLVIRGISDYADAQKNDQWHSYASLTAAAFAKMLLCKVTGTDGVSRVDRRAAKRNFTYSSSPQRGMKRKLDEDSSYSSDAKF